MSSGRFNTVEISHQYLAAIRPVTSVVSIMLKAQRHTMTALIKKAYKLDFGCKIGDQDKTWTLDICCATSGVSLRAWLRGTQKSIPFAAPMTWQEQKDNVMDCYICLTNVSFFSNKTNKSIEFPNMPSAIDDQYHMRMPQRMNQMWKATLIQILHPLCPIILI